MEYLHLGLFFFCLSYRSTSSVNDPMLTVIELCCRPYYETRANYNGILKDQKKRIVELELKVSSAKASYNDALKNLEQISEEIHKMREERRLSGDLVDNYDVSKFNKIVA